MRYIPEIGDNFKLKGRNVFGDVILSERVYRCVQLDSIKCVAKNNDGLEYNFTHNIHKHPFKYVKVE